jgi:hypothetical protein
MLDSALVSRANERLTKAAETGRYRDRKAATEQVAIVLRGRAVY